MRARTGDASPEILGKSIKTLLKERGDSKLKLDALKVSHHGSKGNTSPDLLKMFDCKRFLISTNGNTHFHPDQETIARIIKYNGPKTEIFFSIIVRMKLRFGMIKTCRRSTNTNQFIQRPTRT